MQTSSVIYRRVSDPSQIDNNSLSIQEKLCRLEAKNNGDVIREVYSDEGKSGKSISGRPALKKMLNDCCTKKSNIKKVYIYKLDRLGRNTEQALWIIKELAKYGIEVVSVTEKTDESAMGRGMRSMILVLAQVDNEMKGERVLASMKAVFRNGLWPFKPPIGYKRKYLIKEQNKGMPPIVDDDLFPIIKNMFQKAATGLYNKTQLAEIMNGDGFEDYYQSKASHKTIKKILEKTFYYGEMYVKKWDKYQEGKHEPIIDKETWNKAHSLVILKKKKYSYKDASIYPLKGFIRCGVCNGHMTTCSSSGNGGKYYYYECKDKKCRASRIRTQLAHDNLSKILKDIKPSENVISLFSELVFNEWDKVISKSKNKIKKIEKRINYQKSELSSLRKAKDDGLYTLEQAKEEAKKIGINIQVLEIEKSDIRIEQYDKEILNIFTRNFLLNLDELWLKMDVVKKQKLQTSIFTNGILCKDNKLHTIDLSPSFSLIRSLEEEKGENVTPRQVSLNRF